MAGVQDPGRVLHTCLFHMIYHMRAAGMPVCRHPGLTLCHDIRLADILLCAQWLFMSARMADIVGHAIINN